jgi:hypothetical protein
MRVLDHVEAVITDDDVDAEWQLIDAGATGDHHAAADRAGRDRPERRRHDPANAAALVGAGVLSVLIFPSIAGALARRDRPLPGTPEAVMDAVVVTEARVVGEVSLEGDTPLPDEGEPAEGEPAEPEKSAD